jgi:hypothetical protein
MKITKQFLCSSDWKASRSQEDIMAGSDRRSQKEKMLAGEWYRAIGPEITADHRRAQMLLHAYNSSLPDEVDRRAAILQDLIGRMGEDAVIRPPFQCDMAIISAWEGESFSILAASSWILSQLRWATSARSALWSKSSRLITHVTRHCKSRAMREGSRCVSARTFG